jgi:phosphoglycerate dehydrogenase-like enzyme
MVLMLKGIYLLDSTACDLIYGPQEREEIAALVDIYAPPQTRQSLAQDPSVLADAEVIFSGWGAPVMDATFLATAPSLRAVFYGAGSIRYFVTPHFWERGILVTSAYAANAVPVSEYTLSQILFCLKHGWQNALAIKRNGAYPARAPGPGGYRSTVGVVSLGMIGRLVCERLRPFDLRIIAYDPFVQDDEAARLGVELCSLEDVFRNADVVSLHTPWLPETEGLITGAHFTSMRPDASFVNTARGAIVREQEMIDVLLARPDLYAVLDVTYPEPPVPGSPLYSLPNVVLTPHIAGAMGTECQRMGRLMVNELRRMLAGEPLQWSISRERAASMA